MVGALHAGEPPAPVEDDDPVVVVEVEAPPPPAPPVGSSVTVPPQARRSAPRVNGTRSKGSLMSGGVERSVAPRNLTNRQPDGLIRGADERSVVVVRTVRSGLLVLVPVALLVACSSDSGGGVISPDASLEGEPSGTCTRDAKICPDGTTVGRVGPRCEFAACPSSATPPPSATPSAAPESACKNECGNGTCEEMVCMAVGCPCAETKASCPQDCK
jgi:hypothetical protein